MESAVMLRVGVASSEAFMPYYEFELVTYATCQHQGGMILEDRQGAADQTERLAAELTLVRPELMSHNSAIRVRDHSNAEIYRTALDALAIRNATQVPAHHCTHDSTTFVLPIGHSSGCSTNCTQAHRGGFNSPASQPTASVFIGSTANDAVSVRSQVEHSNVRFSNPDLPGEMRANAIRCLHTGHIGRSLIHAVIHWPQRILIYPNPIFETTNGER
jgi:hypothetical protein